jgi:hypothetical protein
MAAEREIEAAIYEIVTRHALSTGEEIRVVTAAISSRLGTVAKYMIREERHGDTGTPGGLA